MPLDAIVVRGAREHNLKNIDVTIPRDKLVVITGVSGSGKSSLAFDTIYAEGQRRYVESLSAYARQFLGQMEKPEVDYIEGLSPAISIDQRGSSKNPRSTVGTITEIYDYLRLLFARIGQPHCPRCGREISRQSVPQIVDAILNLPPGARFMVLAPMIRDRKGEHQAVFEDLRRTGYVRVRVDGRVRDLSEDFDLDKNKRHTVEAVVDRLAIEAEDAELSTRLADSVETALKLGAGVVQIAMAEGPDLGEASSSSKGKVKGRRPELDEGEELLFSEHFACVHCGISLGEIAPRTFSFNSPHGACPVCTGLGTRLEIDPDLVVNPALSLDEGAIMPWSRDSLWYYNLLAAVAHRYGFSMDTPVKNLSSEHLKIILYGNPGDAINVRQRYRQYSHEYDSTFEGVIPDLERRYKQTESDYVRQEIERYMVSSPCPACQGKRLKPESLAVTVADRNIMAVTALSINEAMGWVSDLQGDKGSAPLTPRQQTIAHQILKEIKSRLGFLLDVGLDYITLDRAAATLAGGEAQRIRLATQIGSGLMGVLYICDEPTIGLHPADDARLIDTLKRLRDLGNTILVVEHDEAMMRAADHIIDMGPGAGELGGWVVASGTLQDILDCPESITGAYLSGRKQIPIPNKRRSGNGGHIIVRGARENNLKNLDIRFPLGKLVGVTGVSGSGKSTLIAEILFKKAAQMLYQSRERPGDCDGIDGLDQVDKVINIDQSPIGRTPRSNPATYTGTFTPIRELFAAIPEAKMRGYRPGRFSFNVKGGRCEACRGEGYIQIEMQFLPDVTVPCEVCHGQRYNREALDVRLRGKNIAEVLAMTVDEALPFFEHFPKIRNKLATLKDVGLGYIRLGQPATTLSGGEAQRVKLSTELSKRATGSTLYLLDEPTTGLSFEDVAALLHVLQRLVDAGNTVIVIEHHLDVVKSADWLIDLGPGGGDKGGYIVAEGTPEDVIQVEASLTGQWLRGVLGKGAAIGAAL